MWKPVDEYCWTNGNYNICKIGSASGYSYEVWELKTEKQIGVNLATSKAAIQACAAHARLDSQKGAA